MSVLSCYTASYTCIYPQGGHGDGPSIGQTIDAAVTVEMDCKKDKSDPLNFTANVSFLIKELLQPDLSLLAFLLYTASLSAVLRV